MMNPNGRFSHDSILTESLHYFKSKSKNYVHELRTREIGMLPKQTFQRVILEDCEDSIWSICTSADSQANYLFLWKVSSQDPGRDCTVWVRQVHPASLVTSLQAFIELKAFLVRKSNNGIVCNLILKSFEYGDCTEAKASKKVRFIGYLFLLVQLRHWSTGYGTFGDDEFDEYMEVGDRLREAIEEPERFPGWIHTFGLTWDFRRDLGIEDGLRDMPRGIHINLIANIRGQKTLISSSQFLKDLREYVHEATGLSGAQLLCIVNNSLRGYEDFLQVQYMITFAFDLMLKGIYKAE